MARSKGPVLPPGGQPGHVRPEPERYPQYGAPAEPAYPQYPQDRPHDGYSYPSHQHQPPPAYHRQDPYGQPEPSLPLSTGYPPPHEPAPTYDPRYAPQSYEPPPAPQAYQNDPSAYGQPYDPYANHQGYAQPGGYPPQRDYAPEPPSYDVPVTEPRTFPPRAEPSLARFQDSRRPPAFDRHPDPQAYAPPEPQLRGAHYDQWAGQDPGQGYDLASYAPPAPGSGADRGRQPPPAPYPVEPLRHDQQIDQNAGALERYDDEDDEEYEDEAPPRRRGRGILVAVALVGAIGLGGGLAYAYKMFFSAPTSSATRVVKAPQQPARTEPADPGGRRFANTDSKVMERLPSDQSAAQGADPAPEDAGGARRVQIIPVTRDGTLAPTPPAANPQPILPQTVGVPGLTIVNTGAPTPPPVAVAPPPPQAGRVPVTPLRPQIVARAEPEEARPEPPAAPAAPAVAPPVAQRVPPVPVRSPPPPVREPDAFSPSATTNAAVTPAAAAREPARKSSSYVAVLSSQKSRVEALSVFADLQQRYADVLSDKVPDVQEADLSSRNLGTLYRLVVGPPGARDKALEVCSQLKSAGYQGCWVTAF